MELSYLMGTELLIWRQIPTKSTFLVDAGSHLPRTPKHTHTHTATPLNAQEGKIGSLGQVSAFTSPVFFWSVQNQMNWTRQGKESTLNKRYPPCVPSPLHQALFYFLLADPHSCWHGDHQGHWLLPSYWANPLPFCMTGSVIISRTMVFFPISYYIWLLTESLYLLRRRREGFHIRELSVTEHSDRNVLCKPDMIIWCVEQI